MINIQNLENGFLIENKLFFSEGNCEKDYINLFSKKGENMNFGCADSFKIDYPGEYDKENIFIVCHMGDENKLNYFIRHDGKYFAIIQNPKMVEKEEFENVKYCLYTDDATLKILERLEYEGQSIKLDENEENSVESNEIQIESTDLEEEGDKYQE